MTTILMNRFDSTYRNMGRSRLQPIVGKSRDMFKNRIQPKAKSLVDAAASVVNGFNLGETMAKLTAAKQPLSMEQRSSTSDLHKLAQPADVISENAGLEPGPTSRSLAEIISPIVAEPQTYTKDKILSIAKANGVSIMKSWTKEKMIAALQSAA